MIHVMASERNSPLGPGQIPTSFRIVRQYVTIRVREFTMLAIMSMSSKDDAHDAFRQMNRLLQDLQFTNSNAVDIAS